MLDDIEEVVIQAELEEAAPIKTEKPASELELLKMSRLLNFLDGRNELGERWDDVKRKKEREERQKAVLPSGDVSNSLLRQA